MKRYQFSPIRLVKMDVGKSKSKVGKKFGK